MSEKWDKRCGEIYVLHCLTTGKKYVGKSLKTTAEKRWDSHIAVALSKCTKPRLLIHKAIRKYGVENFTAEVVETCIAAKLGAAEQRWIRELSTLVPNGYNLTEGGEGSWGFKHRLSTRLKMSKSAQLVWKCEAHRALMTEAHLGKEVPLAVRTKISKTLTGHLVSSKTRKSISSSNKLALENDPKRLARMKAGLHSEPHTDVAKAKMSVAQRQRWAEDYDGMYSAIRGGWNNKSEAEKIAWRLKTSKTLKSVWARRSPADRSAIALKAWDVRRAKAVAV